MQLYLDDTGRALEVGVIDTDAEDVDLIRETVCDLQGRPITAVEVDRASEALEIGGIVVDEAEIVRGALEEYRVRHRTRTSFVDRF